MTACHGGFPIFGLRLVAACLVLVTCGLCANTSAAQTVYRYEDENGVTRFTDEPPRDMEDVDVQKALATPQPTTESRRVGPREAPEWWFRNRLHGPVAVRLSVEELENAYSAPSLPAVQVLESTEDRRLLSVRPIDPSESWAFRFRSISVPGRPDVNHAPHQPYSLPFPSGRTYQITQGFGEDPSHRNSENFHAVDFAMPVGTPVHAARGGVVMEVARGFHEAGMDADHYGQRANFIRVLHDDGTMAVYAHLDFEGALVHPGDRVERGQQIGISGNTGFSSGPHLHFVVQMNREMSLVSVPMEFVTAKGPLSEPRAGRQVSRP